eukprot:15239990-Alexandrium_andersonii.AAC.1
MREEAGTMTPQRVPAPEHWRRERASPQAAAAATAAAAVHSATRGERPEAERAHRCTPQRVPRVTHRGADTTAESARAHDASYDEPLRVPTSRK